MLFVLLSIFNVNHSLSFPCVSGLLSTLLNFLFMKTNIFKFHLYVSPGGSEGLFAQKTLEVTDDILATYKNQGSCGGFITRYKPVFRNNLFWLIFYVEKGVMIYWEGQEIKLEQLSKSMQHLMHAHLWSLMHSSLSEVPFKGPW